MVEFDSIDDVKIGTIFSDSFNGMSDFYEVIDKTKKSITLRKIKWETCDPDSDSDFDPTHRMVHICLDKNGNPIPELNWKKEEIIYRKMSIELGSGKIVFKGPSYGGFMGIIDDKYKKMSFYWG